jgi:histone acetyltransferase (RNA polymerase elongator complex component)
MTRDLAAALGGPPLELAFYGGTFTALPDTTGEALLQRLAAMGLDMVELGVQTFDEAVLKTARRGHTGQDTREACERVRAAGMRLGLQLLPGLPGHYPEAFSKDIATCLQVKPDMVRLHPCLVLAGTGLEPLYRSGAFAPWPLETTVRRLASAVLALWRAGISVARIGLAYEPALEEAVLAGPRHPALGTMVRAQALLLDIAYRLDGRQAVSLALPQRCSGEFWGHAKELEAVYTALGLSKEHVTFEDREDFLLNVIQNE